MAGRTHIRTRARQSRRARGQAHHAGNGPVQLHLMPPALQISAASALPPVQRSRAAATPPIQLRQTMVFTTNAHAHTLKGPNVNSGRFGRVGPKYKAGDTVEVDETSVKTDSKGERFYKLEGSNTYVRASSLVQGSSLTSNFAAAAHANRDNADVVEYGRKNAAGDDFALYSTDLEEEASGAEDFGTTMDEVGGNLGDFNDNSEADSKVALSDNAAKGLGYAAGGFNIASGLFGMGMAIHSIATAEVEEKVEAIFDLLSSTASTVEGAASVANVATDSDLSDGVATYAGTVADAINAIKEGVFTVKKIYDLYKEATTAEGMGGTEKFEASADIIMGLLEAAASTVSAINTILDNVHGSQVLANAVPGMGIALSGAEIAIRVYKIVKANVSRKKMHALKESKKEGLRGRYATYFKEKTRFGRATGDYKTDRKAVKKRINELEKKPTRTPDEEAELVALTEYDFIMEMEYINKKRMTRSGIKIGIELTKIAGEIATLTGYGAVAGVPLKAFAAGTDIGMSVFRNIKQAGRNKAAKKKQTRLQSGGEKSRWEKVFNADKSTENKQLKRRKDAIFIFKQIADLPNVSEAQRPATQGRINDYINAAGAHPKALTRSFFSESDTEEGLRKAIGVLVAAMAQRD